MTEPTWHDLGPVAELARQPLQQVQVGRTKVALSCVDGRFGAVWSGGRPTASSPADDARRRNGPCLGQLRLGDVVDFTLAEGATAASVVGVLCPACRHFPGASD